MSIIERLARTPKEGAHPFGSPALGRKLLGQAVAGIAILAGSAFIAPAARSAELDVPSAYPNIQAAIDAASDGDVVLVDSSASPYTGDGNRDINFEGKAITVTSTGGAANTVIDCQANVDDWHQGFIFQSNEGSGSVLQGFTIKNGFTFDGGAISIAASAGSISPTITQCIFQNNTCEDEGGAIFIQAQNGSPTISQCTFTGNEAISTVDEGDQEGGAISIWSVPEEGTAPYTTVALVNDVFSNNTAGFDGGAIDIIGSDLSFNSTSSVNPVTIDNCTFNGNTVQNVDSSATGVISFFGGNVTISNSILYGDTPGEISALDPPADSGGLLTVQSSDVQGGYAGTGNITIDPQFLGAASGDYRLTATSPAINAGTVFTTTPAIDFNGNSRDATPDLGAYEYIINLFSPGFGTTQYAAFNSQVTSFLDSSDLQASPATFSANIQWGDGSSSAGTVTQPGGVGTSYIVSGTHTYTTYGPQTVVVTVTDTAVTTVPLVVTKTSSETFVTPVDASQFVLSAPSSAVAGTPFNMTVTAEDNNGNVATAYSRTIHFTTTDRYGVVPADSPLKGGVGTFPITLGTVGNQTITLTDTAVSTLTATTGPIAVSPGPTALFGFRVRPTTATGGTAFSINVLALDIYGNLTPAYKGTVHFTSSDPQAVLPANTTLPGGQGAFMATLFAAGNQSITATDTAKSSITNTQPITVVNYPAVRFRVSANATTVVAGTPVTFTVTALDANGNWARGYTGTVHLSSNAVGAVLPSDTTLTNGTSTFPITFTTVGRYTLTATDLTTSSITGTSGTVNLTAGAATQLKATAQTSAVTGKAFGVVVQALDAYGNIATSYTGTVHLTSTDANAVLPANGVLYSGQRTFLATLKTLGGQTVTATDTVNTGFTATTGTVTITAH